MSDEVPDPENDPDENESTDENTVESVDSKLLEMVGSVLTGQLFAEDLATIVDFRKKFGTYLDGMKAVGKLFDEQLISGRQVNGTDWLEEVEFFRKPRESKSTGNSLLDAFRL